MTPDELTKMAQSYIDKSKPKSAFAFAKALEAVILMEREACAKVCEAVHTGRYDTPEFWREGVAYTCAAAIRARSNP